MKKYRKEIPFLEQLAEIPNISLACERVGIARNTVYRWRNEDPDFAARMDEALVSGRNSINDLAESKLVSHINQGNMRAIQYWLDNHRREYIKPRDKNLWKNEKPPVTKIIIEALDEDELRQMDNEDRKHINNVSHKQRLEGEGEENGKALD